MAEEKIEEIEVDPSEIVTEDIEEIEVDPSEIVGGPVEELKQEEPGMIESFFESVVELGTGMPQIKIEPRETKEKPRYRSKYRPKSELYREDEIEEVAFNKYKLPTGKIVKDKWEHVVREDIPWYIKLRSTPTEEERIKEEKEERKEEIDEFFAAPTPSALDYLKYGSPYSVKEYKAPDVNKLANQLGIDPKLSEDIKKEIIYDVSMKASSGELGTPLIDPTDLVTGAVFGKVLAKQLGQKGFQTLKTMAKEAAEEITLGIPSMAKSLAKKSVKIAKSKILKRKQAHLDELIEKTDDPKTIKVLENKKKDIEVTEEHRRFKASKFVDDMGVLFWDNKKHARKALDKEAAVIRKNVEAGNVPEGQIQNYLDMEKAAENAVEKRILMHGSTAEAARRMDEIDNDIFKGLSRKEIKYLNELRESNRSIEVVGRAVKKKVWDEEAGKYVLKDTGKKVKVSGTKEGHEGFLEVLKKEKPESYNKIMEANEKIQNIYKGQLQELVNHGVISKKKFDDIIAKGEHYNPRVLVEAIDPFIDKKVAQLQVKKTKVGSVSGMPDYMKYMHTGTEKSLYKDSRFLIQDYVARTQSAIARNKANRALYDYAKNNPTESIFTVKKGRAKPGRDDATVNVFIDGKKKELIMPAKIAKEWEGLDPLWSENISKWASWLSGTKILKAFATGTNPFFAIRNFARDVAFMYMSPQYSGFLPKFLGQAAMDYGAVFKDAMAKKGRYTKYVQEGGHLETLTEQGRLFDRKFKKIQDALGAPGEFSERWSRLAHRERALKNGLSSEAATFTAREALDFGQGGTFTKSLNSVIPYLGAGIQGTRGMFKFYKKNPKLFKYKLANLMSVAGGLYLWNNQYKEDHDKITDKEKADYWIIMQPTTSINENGEEERDYLAIPKDHSQRIFTAIADNVMSWMSGNEINFEQTSHAMKAITDVLPSGESEMPLRRAISGYMNNLDSYRDKPIYPKSVREPLPRAMETGPGTPEIYTKVGEASEAVGLKGKSQISPARLQYGAEQFITRGNPLANFLGLGLDAILKDMTPEQRAEHSRKIRRNLSAGFLRKTRTDVKLRKEGEEIRMEEAGEKEKLRRAQNKIFDKLKQKPELIEDDESMMEWIQKQPELQREWLGERYEKVLKLFKTTDKKNYGWWIDVIRTRNSIAKARIYFKKWEKASPTKRKEMDDKKGVFGGFGGKFEAKLYELKEEAGIAEEEQYEEIIDVEIDPSEIAPEELGRPYEE